jgi:succinate dehydrogenase / fumarate reductase cytochrome b subunit
MKDYALYPGCSALGGEKELLESVLAIAPALDLRFHILSETTCCGGAHLEERDPLLMLTAHALVFAHAEKTGLPLVTICNTCQLILRESWYKLKADPELAKQINHRLETAGFHADLISPPEHLLTLLDNPQTLDLIKNKRVRDLSGLKIGCYYGCHLLRTSSAPSDFLQNHSGSLESLAEACGATTVDFPDRSLCCGFHVFIHSPKISDNLVAKITDNAAGSGANLLITPCPLCQMSLDAAESKRPRKSARKTFATLHVSQLIGWALGLDKKVLGLQRNLVRFADPGNSK